MKESKFSEIQIVKILGEQEQGKSVSHICCEHGINELAFYGWKSKFGDMISTT
jgi:putative transposase